MPEEHWSFPKDEDEWLAEMSTNEMRLRAARLSDFLRSGRTTWGALLRDAASHSQCLALACAVGSPGYIKMLFLGKKNASYWKKEAPRGVTAAQLVEDIKKVMPSAPRYKDTIKPCNICLLPWPAEDADVMPVTAPVMCKGTSIDDDGEHCEHYHYVHERCFMLAYPQFGRSSQGGPREADETPAMPILCKACGPLVFEEKLQGMSDKGLQWEVVNSGKDMMTKESKRGTTRSAYRELASDAERWAAAKNMEKEQLLNLARGSLDYEGAAQAAKEDWIRHVTPRFVKNDPFQEALLNRLNRLYQPGAAAAAEAAAAAAAAEAAAAEAAAEDDGAGVFERGSRARGRGGGGGGGGGGLGGGGGGGGDQGGVQEVGGEPPKKRQHVSTVCKQAERQFLQARRPCQRGPISPPRKGRTR